MEHPPLPSPCADQRFWDVSALEGGHLWLILDFFITNAKAGEKLEVPCLAFLLRHSHTKQNFLFDIGIRKDFNNLPPPVKEIFFSITPCRVPKDVVGSLADGGLMPDDMEHICISHAHWDHVGDPAVFTKAKFLLGGDARKLFVPGYPADPTSFYASDLLPEDRTEFLQSSGWGPLGPFPRALDYFGDGSLYIVDAPGHLPGHINLLARTSADGAWLFLAGDSAHHWSLITGESEIAGEPDGKRRFGGCAHEDKAQAADTQRRINALMKVPRVSVILAHDLPWYEKHKHSSVFWPGKIESQ